MCEIQDFAIEHKDIYIKKYSGCSEMDLYITDSLQDMLDMDIKNEMATDLSSITDFPDSLGLNFSELPPLLDMDTDNSAIWLNNSSNSFVHNLDLYGSEANAVMVNPNSVMPSTFAETPVKSIVKEEASNLLLTSAANNDSNSNSSAPSPKEEKSHLTFSPNTIKVPKVEPEEPVVKKPLEEATQMVIYVRKQDKHVVKDLLKDLDTSKLKPTTTPTPTQTVRIKAAQELIKVNNKNCSILNTSQKVTQQLGTKTIISGNIHILDAQQSRTILANSNKSQATILIDNSSLNNNRQIIKTSVNGAFTVDASQAKFVNTTTKHTAGVGEFPKPAYSYSCLIAMALKNSRTGSLPVSEIYNFMCQHFPYFKTAPNGWKNSVRHNLSLNKCFEKIEKPSTNGSQRKGCLWAMNPSKVGKMDEEVQKWSRKDPQAIKKAMVYPESLEALERGEMKYSGAAGDAEDDDADVDPDAELDADVEIDPEIKTEVDEEEIIEQEVSDQELEVEEVAGTGMVGGTYRLLAASGALHEYLEPDDDELSDIEVLDQSYEEIDIDVTKPMKLDLSVTENYTIHSAKRAKTNFIYQPVATQAHTSRRKTPLVNRVALI